MHTQVIRKHSLHLLLGVLLSVWVAPAFAQTREKNVYAVAMTNAVREISKDPCNMAGKLEALRPPIIEAAKQVRAGTDDLSWLLQRIANTGCANSKLQLPKVELLLTAGKLRYLDTCSYSPGNDYSAEIAMSLTAYSPLGVGVNEREFDEVPCMADFVAALLTGQSVSQTATAPAAAQPAREVPATRRRTN